MKWCGSCRATPAASTPRSCSPCVPRSTSTGRRRRSSGSGSADEAAPAGPRPSRSPSASWPWSPACSRRTMRVTSRAGAAARASPCCSSPPSPSRVGEWFQISAPGLRGAAPLATASAFGLCFTVEVPEGSYVSYAAAVVIAVTAVSTALGVGARLVARHSVSFVDVTGRLLAVVVVALLYRTAYLGQSAGIAGRRPGPRAMAGRCHHAGHRGRRPARRRGLHLDAAGARQPVGTCSASSSTSSGRRSRCRRRSR